MRTSPGLLLLLSLTLASFVNAQTLLDREMDGLKGKVKSVRVERASVLKRAGQLVEGARVLQSETTYDEKGNRLEEVRYSRNGAVEERVVSGRDENGNQTKTNYKPDGTIVSKWVYTYDAKGKMMGGAQYAADGTLQMKMVREYGADGKAISGAMYDANGALMNKTLFSYDEKGKQKKDVLYNAAGALMQEYARSAEGDTVVLYDNNGTIRLKSVSQAPAFEYDASGNWIKESISRTDTHGDKTAETIEVAYRTITYY